MVVTKIYCFKRALTVLARFTDVLVNTTKDSVAIYVPYVWQVKERDEGRYITDHVDSYF